MIASIPHSVETLAHCFLSPEEIPPAFRVGTCPEERLYLLDGRICTWEGSLKEVSSPICVQQADGTLRRPIIGQAPAMDEAAAMAGLNAAVRGLGPRPRSVADDERGSTHRGSGIVRRRNVGLPFDGAVQLPFERNVHHANPGSAGRIRCLSLGNLRNLRFSFYLRFLGLERYNGVAGNGNGARLRAA